MTQQELLRIYSMYLPYGLKVTDINRVKPHRLADVRNDYTALLYFESKPCRWKLEDLRPYLIPLSDLTKNELQKAGFSDHLDWMTKEREHWICLYGLETFLNKTPHGMIQYLISEHYDIEDLIGKGLAVNKNEI